MAPLPFAKLFSKRSSSRSARSERRTSVDTVGSSESYVISLPSVHTVPTSLSAVASTTSSTDSAELMDDDNLAWGRPSRARRHRGRMAGVRP
ncbi:hypothetical protein C8Q78DRAFT_1083202 [Trametes maxima]|nr:hypothetical protein C8Q78DRAFT_1083202 [Trametes maxima]